MVAGIREATEACGTGWVGSCGLDIDATPPGGCAAAAAAAAEVDSFGILAGGTGCVGSTTEGGLGCVGRAGIISGCVGSAGVMGGGRFCGGCWTGSFRLEGDSIIE